MILVTIGVETISILEEEGKTTTSLIELKTEKKAKGMEIKISFKISSSKTADLDTKTKVERLNKNTQNKNPS